MSINKPTIFALSALALLTYTVESLAWPLHLGRDGLNYIMYYLDMWAQQPVYQLLMVRRTPIAPIFYGLSLSFWGSLATEVISAIMYSTSLLLIYWLACHFGQKIGLTVALLVNFYPAYGSLYHVVASEPPATFFFILICALFFDAMDAPNVKKFALLGVVSVLAILSRPDGVALLGLAVGPFLFAISRLRDKVRFSLTLVAVAISLLLVWSTYNYVRYDDFIIARGEKAQIPLERAFTFAHTVRAENGPASADLVKLVSTELLNKEPYVSYHIDTQTFFSRGTERMFSDLAPLSDQFYGWNSDYSRLRLVGIEAVKANPVLFFWGFFKSSIGMLIYNPEWPVAMRRATNMAAPSVNTDGLPTPSEGDLIPRSYYLSNSSSPDGRAQPVPDTIELRILNPNFQKQMENFNRSLIPYQNMLPNRDGSAPVADLLNQISLLYPPPILWLIMGFVGLYHQPGRYKYMLLLILGIAAVMIFYPMLGIGSVFMMRARYDPLIMLFGVAGFFEIWPNLFAWLQKKTVNFKVTL